MASDDPTYALGRTRDEHERLQRQAAWFRPLTERVFRHAGLAPGQRVLDLGCGVGDVSFLAAEIVGATGHVLGVDLDATAVATARDRAALMGLTNVTFEVGDVRSLTLDAPVDAVTGRFVLLYMAKPAEGLAAALRHVRPGGLAVFQELDMDNTVPARTFPPEPDALWNVTGRAITETFARAGVHVRMGVEILRAFTDAGLPAPTMVVDTPMGGGPAYPGYAWMTGTLRSLAPLAAKTGVTHPPVDGLEDRLREEVVAKRMVVWAPPIIGAWARTSGVLT